MSVAGLGGGVGIDAVDLAGAAGLDGEAGVVGAGGVEAVASGRDKLLGTLGVEPNCV